MIEVKNLSKRYSSGGGSITAVNGVDLQVGEGEFAMVHGSSGCGKSTLLMMIGGMLRRRQE